MSTENYSIRVDTTKTAAEIFNAISRVTGWWTEDFTGSCAKLHDRFTVTFGETFIELEVVELVKNIHVVWAVKDCYKHFLRNKKEWVGSKICFDIQDTYPATLIFTHKGLTSGLECYAVCSNAWDDYIRTRLIHFLNSGTATSLA